MTNEITRLKEWFLPPAPEREAPAEGPTYNETVRALKVGATIPEKRRKLQAEGEKAIAEFRAAEQKFFAAKMAIQEATIAMGNADEAARKARGRILSGSKPSAEEQQLFERAMAMTKKVAELKCRHQVYEATIKPPEESDEFRKAAQLKARIAELEQVIRHSKAEPGTSFEDSELRMRQVALSNLESALVRQRRNYEHWLEIQEAKKEAQRCHDERERLRTEREEAAIAAALGAK